MKIVFDTNVLISAIVFGGLSADVFDYCINFEEIYISPWILDECLEKMKTKLKIPENKLSRVTELIREGCQLFEPDNPLPTACRDHDDNHVLQLAEFIRAAYIITGDKDLLDLNKYKKTLIWSPRQFWGSIQKIH